MALLVVGLHLISEFVRRCKSKVGHKNNSSYTTTSAGYFSFSCSFKKNIFLETETSIFQDRFSFTNAHNKPFTKLLKK